MSIDERTLFSFGSRADCRGTGRVSLPRPPKDFTLNKLLKDVADYMSQEDFDNIKFLFRGDDGFGKRVLEQMKSPLDLFTYMKEYRFISRDNIIYLQYILKELNNDKLLQQAVQYAQTRGETLYFYSPSSEPVNGYTHVRVHVAGKDLNNFNRTDLEELRTILATLLFMPARFIVMDGIEEASSLLITILIPSKFADILRKLAIDKKCLAPLLSIGIDVIAVGKETFNVDSRTAVTDQIKVSTTYEQLEEKTRLLEERDNEVIKLTRKLREQKEMTQELKDKTTVKEVKDKLRKRDRMTQTMDVASPTSLHIRHRFPMDANITQLKRIERMHRLEMTESMLNAPLQRVNEKELERQTLDLKFKRRTRERAYDISSDRWNTSLETLHPQTVKTNEERSDRLNTEDAKQVERINDPFCKIL